MWGLRCVAPSLEVLREFFVALPDAVEAAWLCAIDRADRFPRAQLDHAA